VARRARWLYDLLEVATNSVSAVVRLESRSRVLAGYEHAAGLLGALAPNWRLGVRMEELLSWFRGNRWLVARNSKAPQNFHRRVIALRSRDAFPGLSTNFGADTTLLTHARDSFAERSFALIEGVPPKSG